MNTLTQQQTAQIIPFSRLAARMELRDAESLDRARPTRALPVIEWGSSHYHEAAIAEERRVPRA